MNKTLTGSIQSHQHLFKLIRYLTYFIFNLRRQNRDTDVKTLLSKWVIDDPTKQKLILEYFEQLDEIIMPIVNTSVWGIEILNEDETQMTPQDIKEQIINIIKEHCLPF